MTPNIDLNLYVFISKTPKTNNINQLYFFNKRMFCNYYKNIRVKIWIQS